MSEKNTVDPHAEEDFTADLVTVIDEEGIEHSFEELDRIETDEGKFIALLPIYDEAEDILSESGELIVLQVSEEEDEIYLEPIEDDELFNKVGNIFEERLQDIFEFDDNDGE